MPFGLGRVLLILAVMPRSIPVESDHGGQESIILALPPCKPRNSTLLLALTPSACPQRKAER